jgi:hypothetical protein
VARSAAVARWLVGVSFALGALLLLPGAPAAAQLPAQKPEYTAVLMGTSQLGIASEAAVESEYALWAQNAAVQPALRGTQPDPGDPIMATWEQKGLEYYWTVASSDYATTHRPLYACTAAQPTCKATLDAVLARPHSAGLYLHEVVSFLAFQNGWNWPAAPAGVDWPTIKLYLTEANAYGKTVIWSEPSHGWESLLVDPALVAVAGRLGRSLVPTFGTNFPSDVNLAMSAARQAAQRYSGGRFGASIQSWFFVDQNQAATTPGALVLAATSLAAGATTFEVEGAPGDMQTLPPSPYMQGINSFEAGLLPSSHPAATTTTITSDDPDPSWAGQTYRVQWSVTGPRAPMGSVLVTDGFGAQCSAPVQTGYCDLVSTAAAATTLTATYSGDAELAGSSGVAGHQVLSTPPSTIRWRGNHRH